MKTKWFDTKNTLDGISNKLDTTDEKISKHEDIAVENAK